MQISDTGMYKMKKKISFIGLLCLVPLVSANAAVPYRVQQVVMPEQEYIPDSFADAHRFYVGGAYNFALWNSYTDSDNVHVAGKNAPGFDVVAGIRVSDVFRIEADYINTSAKYTAFKLTNSIAMINAVLDARVDNMFRLFYTQHMVPYIGVGGGLSWNSGHNVHIDDKVSPAVAGMAGIGIELGEYFTIDLGYRYLYMFSPKFDDIKNLNPTANQFRAGVRVNF